MSEAEEDAFDQWAAMPDHLRPPLNDDRLPENDPDETLTEEWARGEAAQDAGGS